MWGIDGSVAGLAVILRLCAAIDTVGARRWIRGLRHSLCRLSKAGEKKQGIQRKVCPVKIGVGWNGLWIGCGTDFPLEATT